MILGPSRPTNALGCIPLIVRRRRIERRRRGQCGVGTAHAGGSDSPVILHHAFIASVGGEAVEPAGAAGVDERLLGATLAHMGRIPRHVPAARPVGVAKHGARAIRWNVRVLLRQGHGIRGPVVAGMIGCILISARRSRPAPSAWKFDQTVQLL